MKTLGIILLVVILSIVVPTRDRWNYKIMRDRNSNSETGHNWGERPSDEADKHRR